MKMLPRDQSGTATDASRWRIVQDLFHQASELEPSARAAFLEASGADAQLLHQVHDLLTVDDDPNDTLSHAVVAAAAAVTSLPAGIGAYRIVRQLGAGGMGAVYLAVRDDDQYDKQVAIKLVKAGLEAPAFARRFRAERQILANLDHPYIARLLDGGATEAGAPYLVMEYVEGVSIGEYCRERSLPVRDRVRLFQRVCEAVSYAHRSLVIHRDLKPANILITAEGIPKLLDFGIAKVLERGPATDAALTHVTERLMTPEYASPEQVRGEPITTAADVYSLGLILYELLSGVKAHSFGRMTPAQIETLISEQPTTRPSVAAATAGASAAAQKAIRGDLDNIVMMALRKDAARRYSSVDALSADLRRYIDGYPVAARGESWSYAGAKFVRRHRVAVAAAAMITIGLISALILTLAAQTRAEAARLDAQKSFEQALEMSNSSLFEIHDAIAGLSGSIRARQLLVNRTLAHLASLARLSGENPAVQRELATAYERLADIQYRDDVGHLGDSAGGLVSARKALALRESLAASNPSELANAGADHVRIGVIQRLTRNLTGSLASYQNALGIYRELADPGMPEIRRKIAEVEMNIGDVARLSGKLTDSKQYFASAMNAYQALQRESPTAPEPRRGFVNVSVALADLQVQMGERDSSVITLQKALPLARALVAEDPRSARRRTLLASVFNRLGIAHQGLNDPVNALRYYRESESVIAQLAHENPEDARLRRSVEVHGINVAIILEQTGAVKEAEARYRQSCDTYAKMLENDPASAQARDDLAYANARLGRLLTKSGGLKEAQDRLGQALSIRLQLVKEIPDNVVYAVRLAHVYEALGDLASRSRSWSTAASRYEAARRIVAPLPGRIDVTSFLAQLNKRIAASRQSR